MAGTGFRSAGSRSNGDLRPKLNTKLNLPSSDQTSNTSQPASTPRPTGEYAQSPKIDKPTPRLHIEPQIAKSSTPPSKFAQKPKTAAPRTYAPPPATQAPTTAPLGRQVMLDAPPKTEAAAPARPIMFVDDPKQTQSSPQTTAPSPTNQTRATAPAGPRQSLASPPIKTGGPATKTTNPSPQNKPDPYKFGGTPKSAAGNRFANYIKKHPKGVIYGAVALVFALISAVITIISIPFQILHMAKAELEAKFGPKVRLERKMSLRSFSKLFELKSAENGGATPREGFLSRKLKLTPLDKFTKTLANENLKLEFDAHTGRLTGIRNTSTGELLKDFSESSFLDRRKAIGQLVTDRIAPWRVLKRVRYLDVMRYHGRVSFKFWPKEKVQDVKKLLSEKITHGATNEELLKPGQAPDPSDTHPADPKSAGDARDGVQAVEDTFAKTGNKLAALRAGAKVIREKGGKFFGLTAILALVCTIREVAANAATEGFIKRVDELERMGNLLPTLSSQLVTGQNLDIDKFAQVMEIYEGDASADQNSLDRKAWDQSAAAKRLAGDPVVTDATSKYFNPDFSEASSPDGFALQKIVDRVNAVMDVSGVGFLCKVVTGVTGWIIQGIELASALLTASASEIAVIAAQAAIQYYIFTEALPKILSAAANIAITGVENSVDMFNNGDAGLQLSAEDYTRNYGGRQISDDEQLALVNAAHNDQVQIAREKGWFYRTFDLNNTDSIAAGILMKVPQTPQTALAALTSLPKNLTSNLGSIFMGSIKTAHAADLDSVNPYRFQFYGFTEAEIDKYPDMIANEDYLGQAIPGTDKTRLSVLGDPTEYAPANGDDTNMDDLMHCFVNAARAPQELEKDAICKGIGMVTGVKGSGSRTDNPGDTVVQKIYDDNGLGITANDDFLRYRMELFYVHIVRGINCAATDEPCFQGSGAAPAPTTPAPSAACQASEDLIDCAARLATAILGNPNIDPVGARGDLQAAAAKQEINNSSSCNRPAHLDPNLLYALQQTASAGGFNIRLSNIITPHRCDSLSHPKGKAFDVDNLVDAQGRNSNAGHASPPGTPADGENPAVDKAFAEYIANLLPNGGGVAQAVKCFPANIPATIHSGYDECSHIHVTTDASNDN
ncbi:MAG TPA: hypothetical protein VMT30_08680 [Candidatus Saccharimonadia bacterium]|nr:hypothetical protein [Candidatus Saccharimonadia bacterium]